VKPTGQRRRLPAPGLRAAVYVALRQLWARKLLNGIALAGVTLGVTTLVVMHGIMSGFSLKFTQSILKVAPHVTVNATELRPGVSFYASSAEHPIVAQIAHLTPADEQARLKRPADLLAAMRGLPEVSGAAASVAGSMLVAYGGKTRPLDLRGVEIDAQERVTSLRPYVLAGSLAALASAPDGIAIGAGLARELGLSLGSVVHTAAPGAAPSDFRVVAIFEVGIPPVDRSRGYVQLRAGQRALGRPGTVDRIELRLHDAERARAVASLLERSFAYDAESWQEANANSLGLLAMQESIGAMVTGAILVVGGFGILAVQIMIVMQKQRDIAILRAVGFRRGDILQMFLLQGVILALLGGLTGDLLAKLVLTRLALMRVHTESLVQSDRFLVHDDPGFYLTALLFAALLGVFASVVPAWRASKVEPVDVLRGMVG
jgi:lipoprotein-releasing system permease protein